MLATLSLAIGTACLLVALAITLFVILRRVLQGADQITAQIQFWGQMHQEQAEIQRQNLTWMQSQLQLQRQTLEMLREQLHLMRQAANHAARPLLSANVEKIERQRYTLRLRNEGLGPALAISYTIKDSNLRTFDVNSQMDHQFLGVGASGLLQLNMLGLPLPHEFLVLRYRSMTGEQCETHLSWKKGVLSSEYRVSAVSQNMPLDAAGIKENPPAEQELAG